MRMLEDMVEKKMSSHHLDESKHKGKGNKEPETKAQILLDNKEFGSIDVLGRH